MSAIMMILLGASEGVPDQTYWIIANTNSEWSSAGNGITSDNDQNVYTSGKWVDGSNLQAFVESYDIDGAYRWSKSFGGSLAEGTNSIVSDGADIYFHGYLRGGLPGASTHNENGIIKINTSGASQWQKIFGANYGNSNSLSIEGNSAKRNILANDNIFTVQTHATGNGIFITKYNKSGTQQFKYKILEASYQVTGSAIQVDSSGNMYICGRIRDTSSGTNYNGFIIKTNSSGVVQWTHMHGGSSYDVCNDILISGSDLYATGRTYSGGNVIRVMKLNASNGSVTWQKKMYQSTSFVTAGESLQMDSAGALYVVCSESNYKSLVIKLDSSNGNTTWARRFRDGNDDPLRKSLHSLAFDKYNNMLISGTSISYSSSYSQHRHGLICKLPNDGTGTGTYTFADPYWAVITYESISLTNTTLSADVSSTSVSWSTTTPSLTEQNPNLSFSNTGFSRAIKTVTAG